MRRVASLICKMVVRVGQVWVAMGLAYMLILGGVSFSSAFSLIIAGASICLVAEMCCYLWPGKDTIVEQEVPPTGRATRKETL